MNPSVLKEYLCNDEAKDAYKQYVISFVTLLDKIKNSVVEEIKLENKEVTPIDYNLNLDDYNSCEETLSLFLKDRAFVKVLSNTK